MYTELVKFSQNLASESKSQFTIDAYVKDIEQLFVTKKINAIAEISAEILQEYVNQLLFDKTFSRKSISRKVNSIRKFVHFINQKYRLEIDPLRITAPKTVWKKQRIIKKEEIAIIRDQLRSDLKCFTMFEILLQTGIRISELAEISQYDVNFKRRILTIPSLNGKKPRQINLNDKAYYILKDYIQNEKSATCDYIFHTSTNKPIQIRNIRLMLDRAIKRAGIEDVMINDIRNTFIVRQLEACNSLEFVSETVGHSSRLATQRYEKLAQINGKKSKKNQIVEL
jgi:site-specific recombinase XerD